MSECFKNNLPEEAHCKEQSPEISDRDIIEALKNTGKWFSECQEPKSIQAKKFALTKLWEFENLLRENNKITQEYEVFLSNVYKLLKGWATQKEIVDMVLSTSEQNYHLLEPFLPREYTTGNTEKTKSFNKEIRVGIALQETKTKMNEYITGERKRIPTFYNEDFNGLQDVITKALQKPGTILSKYDFFTTDENLSNNPKFLTTLNDILASEYPELFWKDQQMALYGEKLWWDIKQITMLLDIIKYSPELKDHFIDMMSAASRHDQVTMLALYNTHFVRTEIGRQIYTTFKESFFIDHLQWNVTDTLNTFKHAQANNKSDIYEILTKDIEIDGKKARFALEGFSLMPPEHLNTFLSKLPEIEAFCAKNDVTGLTKYLETFGDIDIIYKRFFMEVLKNTQDGSKKDPNASTFYANIVDHYYKELDVSTEVNTITGHVSENKKERRNFKIIEDQFPDKTPENREEKNKELSRILNIFVVDGKINVDEARFVELQDIFKWSPLEERLKWQHGGQEMLKIIAEAARQAKENTVTDILIIDPSFKEDTINHLFINKPKEYQELQKFLLWNETVDAKIKTLKQFEITTKQFWEWDDKEGYIKLVQQYFKSEITIQTTQSILADDKKLQVFEQYYRGEIESLQELNTKLDERDQEIKKQQAEKQTSEKTWIPEKQVQSYDTIASLGGNFTKIPDNQIISCGDIFIKKDSENTISLFSHGVIIDKYKIDKKDVQTSIQKAMESVNFLKDAGLGIFGTALPSIIAAINNRPSRWSKEKIELSDGISKNEGFILLESLGEIMGDEKVEWDHDQKHLETLQKTFLEKGGGLLSRLQKSQFATHDTIHVQEIIKHIQKEV